MPIVINKLQDIEVVDVYCGAQFSMALSKDGKVFSWGKGEGWKLGHASEEHVRFPEPIQALQGTPFLFNYKGSLYYTCLWTKKPKGLVWKFRF